MKIDKGKSEKMTEQKVRFDSNRETERMQTSKNEQVDSEYVIKQTQYEWEWSQETRNVPISNETYVFDLQKRCVQ